MDDELRALKWRAWHRGTKEADLMIGGFFDRDHQMWSDSERRWFSDLLAEQDVDIMAWAVGTQEVPTRYEGVMMERLKKLDYISIAR